MNIRAIVTSAYTKATGMNAGDANGDKGALHRNRSRNFVECLSDELLTASSGLGKIVSLSKHHDRDRSRFGMNELLYDIAVVEYGMVPSGASAKDLSFIKRGIWIVESEMARDKRAALIDFNKLVLGRSENTLFVGSRVSDEVDYLRVLGTAAKYCDGNVFVALIPHPGEWSPDMTDNVVAWYWESGDWAPVA